MTTLITGATSGIGESLAKLYADNNEQVIACGRNTEKLAKLSQHQNIESCQFDATDFKIFVRAQWLIHNLTGLFSMLAIVNTLMMLAILTAVCLSG